jgi:PKD repeat protein
MRFGWLFWGVFLFVAGFRCGKEEESTSPPVADFTYQVTDPGRPPARVVFTDASVNADSRFWFFFPGANSTETNPVVDFRASGTFRVRMTASNTGGEDTVSKDVVIPPLRYLARFSIPPLPPDLVLPVEVRIIDESIGTAVNYFWDFGNGTTSTNVNPIATYTAFGDYTIRQVINFPEGPDSSRMIIRIRP